MAAWGQPAPALSPQNPNGDHVVQSPPSDGVSSLSFSPGSNMLAAGSWDNKVSVYELSNSPMMDAPTAMPRAQTALDGPVMCTSFSADGQYVFAGGCDKTVRMWQLANAGAPAATIGQHDAPVKHVFAVSEMSLVASGGWDRTVRFWDTRQPTPAAVLQMPERVYAMDVRYPLMVVGTAERKICIYNLAGGNWQTPYRQEDSPLRYQTRCIATFPNQSGFAIGSIEGRVAIHHVDPKDAGRNFAFKCHREQNGAETHIYSVNSIAFHDQFHTFATAGADGVFNFWDKDSKQRLMAFKKGMQPISCSAFSPNGAIYAYAYSYDWSKGSEHHNPATPNSILLHAVKKEEIQQRAKAGKNRQK